MLSHLLVLRVALASSCVFSAPDLEPAVSPGNPGSRCWGTVSETKTVCQSRLFLPTCFCFQAPSAHREGHAWLYADPRVITRLCVFPCLTICIYSKLIMSSYWCLRFQSTTVLIILASSPCLSITFTPAGVCGSTIHPLFNCPVAVDMDSAIRIVNRYPHSSLWDSLYQLQQCLVYNFFCVYKHLSFLNLLFLPNPSLRLFCMFNIVKRFCHIQHPILGDLNFLNNV